MDGPILAPVAVNVALVAPRSDPVGIGLALVDGIIGTGKQLLLSSLG